MKISERLLRSDDEDIILLGNVIEQGLNSEFGQITLQILSNFKSMWIQNSIGTGENSDQLLGRLQAIESIIGDLKGFIEERNRLQLPMERDMSETTIAEEQKTPIRGGTI